MPYNIFDTVWDLGIMDLNFEKGDPQRPKGHALAYFRTHSEPDKVYATYIIVLPLKVDFSKYVPPFLTSHLANMTPGDLSAFSLPPVPEEISSHQELQQLAELRDDDLLFAGTMLSFDLSNLMETVGDIVNEYARMWSENTRQNLASGRGELEDSSNVNEVLYGMMSDKNRLEELSKMVGKLRFAVEGNDYRTGQEVEEEIRILARHLPEEFHVTNIVQSAMDSSAKGAKLAQLYMDRCYKLCNDDKAAAIELETQIDNLKASA